MYVIWTHRAFKNNLQYAELLKSVVLLMLQVLGFLDVIETYVLLRENLQGAAHDAEGRGEVPARARRRGGGRALRRSEPSVHPGRRAVGRAEELLQLVVAELPHEVSQPEHVLEEAGYGGPSWRDVAGIGAELRFRRLGHQPGTQDLRPLGAGGPPRSHP